MCVNGSLIDLAGLQVGAQDFLAAVLNSVAQPVWVVDPDGVIRFANPAAIAVLGYDRAEELLGRKSHETIHHSHPDGSLYPAADCPMLLPRTTGETVARDLDWFFRRDGSMFPVSYVSVPLEMVEGRGAVVAFTDIEERMRAERELRERDELLTAQQASLRRLATLVARGAAPAEMFAAIAREVGDVIGLPLVALWRFEPDETATVIGAWGERSHPFQAGTRWPLDGPTICARVRSSGRPERIDDFAGVPGTIADAAREAGIRGCAGAPIFIDGEIWGAMSADATAGSPLPARVEAQLAEFTELIATAISNVQARSELAASRARVVAAADEERRRVVRDLHDGAQQRLVHAIVTLQLALQESPESELLHEALTQAQRATVELRELAQGILPAILTQGGLGPALEGLASRTPVPVEVAVAVDRLPAAVEATAYFVVSEALTNVAKHAGATGADVQARVEDGVLRLRVRDDGVGGAGPAGSGLIGLADRLAALDGELRLESPPGGGTLVAADIPVRSRGAV